MSVVDPARLALMMNMHVDEAATLIGSLESRYGDEADNVLQHGWDWAQLTNQNGKWAIQSAERLHRTLGSEPAGAVFSHARVMAEEGADSYLALGLAIEMVRDSGIVGSRAGALHVALAQHSPRQQSWFTVAEQARAAARAAADTVQS